MIVLLQDAVPLSLLIEDLNPDIITAYRQYLNKHPEQFMKYPSVVGNKVGITIGGHHSYIVVWSCIYM